MQLVAETKLESLTGGWANRKGETGETVGYVRASAFVVLLPSHDFVIFTAVSSKWREEEGVINRDLNSINQTEINLPR